MKKYLYYLPFIIAMISIFINHQTVYTRIMFAAIGVLTLGIAIKETINAFNSKE